MSHECIVFTSLCICIVLELQKALLDKSSADLEITDDFIHKFSEVIGGRWPLLASLLSFTTAEIEQIKREVTGVLSVKAAAMMARWRERSTPTYGALLEKVSAMLLSECIHWLNFRHPTFHGYCACHDFVGIQANGRTVM